MRETVKNILKKLHLFNFVKWGIIQLRRCRGKCFAALYRRAFFKDFELFSHLIERAEVKTNGIVVVGLLCTPHKPTLLLFLSKLMQQFPDKQLILLDEIQNQEPDCPFVRFRIPRSVPAKYDRHLKMAENKDAAKLLSEKVYLQEAVANILSRHKDITKSYAEVLVYTTYLLYNRVIEKWKPSCVMIWSEYNALHTVCAKVCRENGVEPVFLEFGILPGTFALERGGQMGKSEPAVHWQEFLRKPVTEENLRQATDVLAFLHESKLNRNVQPKNNDIYLLEKRLKPGRPTILFAGQKDFDCGMVPYTEETKKFHSPTFATSLEAVEYLSAIAEKNNWNFIFKPHPGMVTSYRKIKFSSNTIYVDRIDLNDLIDTVDAVITIMSQTAYVSLIRNRAVVMLGYNQLRGKGCTYEAFSMEDIESQIKKAIEDGYTEKQKEMFTLHTAQLLTYYLFDDLKERPIRYGRRVEEAFREEL